MQNRVQTGSHFEEKLGYSRAAIAGEAIYVSGCSGLGAEGEPTDAHAQFLRAGAKVKRFLEAAGARLEDVVRTRVYLVDPADWEAVGAAHAEVFGAISPACTMVQVAGMIDPAMKIELEVTAHAATRG